METWLIILITVSSGLALFVFLFYLKTKKEKRKQNTRLHQPVVMITNSHQVPNTNHSSMINYGTPPTMYQNPVYPLQGQQIHPNRLPMQQNQPIPMRGTHNDTTEDRAIANPAVPLHF